MSQRVPIDDFQWANCDDWTVETIQSLDSEAEISYMFEVDLEIPEAIHDRYFTFQNLGHQKPCLLFIELKLIIVSNILISTTFK